MIGFESWMLQPGELDSKIIFRVSGAKTPSYFHPVNQRFWLGN
jgi:hypothetical protein